MRSQLVRISLALVLSLTVGFAVETRSSTMFNADALLKDVQILSSDDMQGRRVDTPGSEMARKFIVERFKAAGIQPIGDSYLEPFSYTPQPRRGAAAGAATVHG